MAILTGHELKFAGAYPKWRRYRNTDRFDSFIPNGGQNNDY